MWHLCWSQLVTALTPMERPDGLQGDLKDKWRNWQKNVNNGWVTARVYMPDDLKQRIEKLVGELAVQHQQQLVRGVVTLSWKYELNTDVGVDVRDGHACTQSRIRTCTHTHTHTHTQPHQAEL